MALIIGALLAGLVLGLSGIFPKKWLGPVNKLITVTMVIMLVALGAQIGSNEDLFRNLAALGTRALGITLFSITGSVVLLWLVDRCCDISLRGRNEKI